MLITIITAVKNDEKNILRTINSVKKQNFKDYEHLIIDGNSKDNTTNIIKKNKNKKIKYINKKDKNLYEALNNATKIAKGKYICLLHSGDIFINKDFLNKISKKLSLYDMICGNIIYKKKNKIIRIWNHKIDRLDKFNCFKIAHTSIFIKKNFLKKYRYNTKYNISSDTDFLIRLSSNKELKFKHYDFYFIIMSTGGLSTSTKNLTKKIYEDLSIYKKNFGFFFIPIYIYKIGFKIYKFLYWKYL